METSLDMAMIVSSILNACKKRHPLLEEEVEEIQSAVSVPRIRIKLKTGETFVIDITREPRPTRRSF